MSSKPHNDGQMRAPDDTHRHVILGQNGTGKSVAGVAALSVRSYDIMPWIIVNYKRDQYIEQIPGVREIDPNGPIPNEPGLFMVRPEPQDYSLDPMLLKAYKRGGHVGFYFDETLDIGMRSQAFKRILSQGRAMHIPAIALSQRPVWLSKHMFTEANFFQIFPLIDVADRKHITGWVKGLDINYEESLEDYQSFYFDAGRRRLVKLDAFPYGDEVLDIFDRRRPRRLQRLDNRRGFFRLKSA